MARPEPTELDPDQTGHLPPLREVIDRFLHPWPARDPDSPAAQTTQETR